MFAVDRTYARVEDEVKGLSPREAERKKDFGKNEKVGETVQPQKKVERRALLAGVRDLTSLRGVGANFQAIDSLIEEIDLME